MNLAALQTFLAIVETGSLVRASARLNVTQSTVTARLKGLEEELGQTLLYRQKSGVSLTSAGFKFKRYAEAMAGLWHQARQEASLPAGISAFCNMGCHTELWPVLGRQLFGAVRRDHPDTAMSVWPAGEAELEQWIGTGLIDAALTFRPTAHENRTTHELPPETLIRVATRPDAGLRFDQGYVFVDAGEEFGRNHAEAYADAGTTRVSFGSAAWALDYLLDNGGSAYLPERLAAPHLEAGRLYPVPGAPVFSRATYLVTNDAAAAGWPWLPALVADLARRQGASDAAPI